MKNIPNRTWTITPLNGRLTSSVLLDVPAQVTGLGANLVGAEFADLTWNTVVGATGYRIRVNGFLMGFALTDSFRVQGLAPNTGSNITVAALNAVDVEGPASATIVVTTTTLPSWLGQPFPNFQQGAARDYSLAAFIQPETAGTYASTGTSLPTGITLNTSSGLLSHDGSAALSDVSTYTFTFDDGVNPVTTISNVRVRVNADSIPTVPTTPLSASITATGFTLSWTASTDSGGNLQGYRIWRNGLLFVDTGSTAVSYAVTGQQTGQVNKWRISAYDTNGNESGRSAVLEVTQGAVSTAWSLNTPSYLPIVPGSAGFGANQFGGSGRHLGAGNNAAILFIDSLGNGSTGTFDSATRIGYGTFKFCMNFNAPRHVIPLVAGTIDFGGGTDNTTRNFIINNPYLTYHGHAAPGHLVLRGLTLIPNGHDSLFMHMEQLQDLFATDTIAASRADCVQILVDPQSSKQMFANCAFMWAIDEQFDNYRNCDNITVWQSIIAEGLTGGDPAIWINSGMVFRNDSTPISVHRSLFAHHRQRNPLSSALNLSMLNNVIYDVSSQPIALRTEAGDTPNDNNVEGNLLINGPANPTLNHLVRYHASMAGRVYMAGNEAIGHTYSTQAQLTSNPSRALEGSRIAAAYPTGYVVTPISSANKSDFADLVLRHVGPKPTSRLSTFSRVVNHVYARMSGVGNQGGHVGVPNDVGGFPSITPVGPIDPANPGAHWGGVPVPMTLSTRNVVQASDYTLIEEWSHGVASLFMPSGWDD